MQTAAVMGTETAGPPTLAEVGKRSEENLRTGVALLARLSQVADHLGGPMPTDGCAKAAEPPRLSAVDVLLRDGEDLASVLYGLRCQIDRIERTLGVCFAPPDAEGPPLTTGVYPLASQGARLGGFAPPAEDPALYRGLRSR